MNIKKYIYGHCVSPVRTKVFDTFSHTFIYRDVPCGKCLHCRNTRINEWVTRLFAEFKYRKYCYFVSLDYAPFTLSDPTSRELARDTAAFYHNINKNSNYGLQPLVLCKSHLQKFYKRLRFNTNVKCSYFACGEYGEKFSRPHFHNIIFSDSPLSEQDFVDAWTLNSYKIGRVDFKDMHDITLNDKDNLKIFKYVAKYIQKGTCDFEKLVTIDFHRSYFKSLNETIKNRTLFSVEYDYSNENRITWQEYTSEYSPFVVCSRRPSIGSAYFEDNVERFKAQDFRLFGLSNEVCSFPHYYIRRTKENLCQLRAVGEISQKPSSSSRLGVISQILRYLYDTSNSIDNWNEKPLYNWCRGRDQKGCPCLMINENDFRHSIKYTSLNFYNSQTKIFYQFNGNSYTLWQKMALSKYGYMRIGNLDILSAANYIDSHFQSYYDKFIVPLHELSVLKEYELIDYISKNFKNELDFKEVVYKYYQIELDSIYKKSLLVKNSRQNL